MSNEELFEKLLYVCNRARAVGKTPVEIIGMLELVKHAEAARCVKFVESKPPILPATGLPPQLGGRG